MRKLESMQLVILFPMIESMETSPYPGLSVISSTKIKRIKRHLNRPSLLIQMSKSSIELPKIDLSFVLAMESGTV